MFKRRKLSGGKRSDIEFENDDDKEEAALMAASTPDDTSVAVELLRQQFPTSPAAGRIPVVLVAQIYSIVHNKTEVDRQIDKAVKEQRLRLFNVAGHVTETYLVTCDDYRAVVETAKSHILRNPRTRVGGARRAIQRDHHAAESEPVDEKEAATRQHQQQVEFAFRRFVKSVIPATTKPVIAQAELRRLLHCRADQDGTAAATAAHRREHADSKCAGGGGGSRAGRGEGGASPFGGHDRDEALVSAAISLLEQSALLQKKDATSYAFALPGLGSFFNEAQSGRQELLKMLSRKKFSEALVKELESNRLKTSTLGSRFHVRDLIGRGSIEVKATTAGQLAKLIHSRESA